MKLTYEELEEKLSATEEKLSATEEKLESVSALLKQALERIADLEDKLKLNSKNSSKPPSTDQKSDTPPKVYLAT